MNDNLERYSIFLDKYVLTERGHNFYSINQEMLSLNHNKFRKKMWKIKEERKTGEKSINKGWKKKIGESPKGEEKRRWEERKHVSKERKKYQRESEKKGEKNT